METPNLSYPVEQLGQQLAIIQAGQRRIGDRLNVPEPGSSGTGSTAVTSAPPTSYQIVLPPSARYFPDSLPMPQELKPQAAGHHLSAVRLPSAAARRRKVTAPLNVSPSGG
jgi:hypothetical protein